LVVVNAIRHPRTAHDPDGRDGGALTAAALPEMRLTFTIAEAAALLGISASTAYECVQRDELPALRFGRRVVITRATLVRLLDIDERASNSPSNRTGQTRRSRWIRVPEQHVEADVPDWARPHRQASTE
jgi:excisionase family DNA binding protein